jgi:REP element-mobilizing transposase RayT
MPNHFHLVLEPAHQIALSRFMKWLLTSHVRRYHRHYGSSGHVWQGRFKSFPVQRDEHRKSTWTRKYHAFTETTRSERDEELR